jgi:hypothetical protein
MVLERRERETEFYEEVATHGDMAIMTEILIFKNNVKEISTKDKLKWKRKKSRPKLYAISGQPNVRGKTLFVATVLSRKILISALKGYESARAMAL